MVNLVENPDIRPLVLYIVSHPKYLEGKKVATQLYRHFSSNRYKNITSGADIRILYRRSIDRSLQTPKPIDWTLANATAVVVLIDRNFVTDHLWKNYLQNIVSQAETLGFGARIYPIIIEKNLLNTLQLDLQALKWYKWKGGVEQQSVHLIRELTFEFSRLLRFQLEQLQNSSSTSGGIQSYTRSVNVFLSYSKHDSHGIRIADKFREWLNHNSQLSSFLDIHNIPTGVSFSDMIITTISDSAMVVVYTDSFSSRDWCCREVMAAKRSDNAIIVVNCLDKLDERVFPYLGNVPAIRINPNRLDRIEEVMALLLDEILKNFLWKCRVERLQNTFPNTLFLVRSPEIFSLVDLFAQHVDKNLTFVYPSPPIGTEEMQYYTDSLQHVKLFTLQEFLQEQLK